MERTTIAKTLLTNINTKMQKDGVMIVKPEKKKKKSTYQTTVGSLIEKREKQILSSNISEATGRCSIRWHSTVDYSQFVWNYSNKAENCIEAKWW